MKKILIIISLFVIINCFSLLNTNAQQYAPSENEGKIVTSGFVFTTAGVYLQIDFYDSHHIGIASITTGGRRIVFGDMSQDGSDTYYSIRESISNPDFSGYGPPRFYEYINNISKYWKIDSVGFRGYGETFYHLIPYDYVEPSFNIICNPSVISPGEISNCSLNVTYYSKLDSVNFKLDTDKYDIANISPGEDFDNFNLTDGVYSLTSKDTLVDSEEGRTTTIINFMLKNNNNILIDTTNNVQALNISYVDEMGDSSSKTTTTTVKQNPKNKPNTISNPLTDTMLIDVLLILGCIGVGSLIIIKLKKKEIYGK